LAAWEARSGARRRRAARVCRRVSVCLPADRPASLGSGWMAEWRNGRPSRSRAVCYGGALTPLALTRACLPLPLPTPHRPAGPPRAVGRSSQARLCCSPAWTSARWPSSRPRTAC
jgi:hypothetical protein